MAPLSAPRTFLAFDFGVRRVGVATGNSLTRSATPLVTIERDGPDRDVAIDVLVAEWRPDALVVGVPFHPDGASHVNTERARRFARSLGSRHGLQVHEVDERYSTVEAEREAPSLGATPAAARKRQKASGIDARAAAVILDQFLAADPA